MGGKMSAEWWREYRRRNPRLRGYNRERRQDATVRAQRHAQEVRRRSRLRAMARERLDQFSVTHELIEWARSIVNIPSRGAVFMFKEEVLSEDLVSEAILARLEGRDPLAAVQQYRAQEVAWWCFAGLLYEAVLSD